MNLKKFYVAILILLFAIITSDAISYEIPKKSEIKKANQRFASDCRQTIKIAPIYGIITMDRGERIVSEKRSEHTATNPVHHTGRLGAARPYPAENRPRH